MKFSRAFTNRQIVSDELEEDVTRIKTLIVDDMKLAREHLRQVLATDPEVRIIGEARNGREAVAAISDLRPQLVFLDVQMPNMSGFEVVQAIGGELPMVVFVTAYDEFALRAFESAALDYLLK